MYGAEWKKSIPNFDCSASRGKPRDAEQLTLELIFQSASHLWKFLM